MSSDRSGIDEVKRTVICKGLRAVGLVEGTVVDMAV